MMGALVEFFYHNLPVSGLLVALVVFWIYVLADWLIFRLKGRVKAKRKAKRD